MFGFAWLTLRQAAEALRVGRLEEAYRLLDQPAVRSHRRTNDLLTRIAAGFIARGEKHLDQQDIHAAWEDLLQAERVRPDTRENERLRQNLTRLGLAEMRAMLGTGDPHRAEEAAVKLRQRGVSITELDILEEGVRGWISARDWAKHGEYSLALESLAPTLRVLGTNSHLDDFQAEIRRHQEDVPPFLADLHQAAGEKRWREVVALAEKVLTMAPQHPEARALRTKAWRAIEPDTVAQPSPTMDDTREDVGDSADLLPRFYLWIDGVGAYLICMGQRLTFGQALADTRVDVPLVADVSRLHATLSRDGEGYIVESARPVLVNGAAVGRSLLQSGDRVTLGGTCQFQFRLPVPGNNSARIDLVSGHRLPISVDGVLLMAETLVLSASPQAHVVVPDLAAPIILFRHRDGLGIRHEGPLWVNQQQSEGRTLLPARCSIHNDSVGFAIEPGES